MIAGIKLPNYKDLIPNIFEYDAIRINKLLHMAQDAVITAVFCFFVGIGINTLYPIAEDEKVAITVTMACMQMVTVIIGVYYIRKLTRLIPFFLRFSTKYNPFHKSKDGEGLVGAAIAMGLLLMSTQSNMKDRIKKLKGMVTGDEDTTHLGFFAPLHVTTSGDGAGFDDV
jgi:hypothetical protein